MHRPDESLRRYSTLVATAQALPIAVQRDLATYWGRRQFEARPQDWT